MDLNILFEMTQGMNSASDVANKLMSSKAQNKEFTGMFDNLINKMDESNKTNNDLAINNDKVSKNDVVEKSDNKDLVTTEKVEPLEKEEVSLDEDKIEIIDEEDFDKDEVNDETVEVLNALLQMLKENPEDLKIYFNRNEDGTFEINLDNLDLLKVNFDEFIKTNNIEIDMDLLNVNESFDFEKVLEVSLDFTKNEVNKEVNLLNLFTKDNDEIIEDTNLLLETEDAMPVLDTEPETKEEIVMPKEEVKSDDFTILKDVINEMIDEVHVTKEAKVEKETIVTNEVSEEIITDVKPKEEKNINEVIIDDEVVTEIKEEVTVEKVDKTIEKETTLDEEVSHKEVKKDHKVHHEDRVLESKPNKPIFNMNEKISDDVMPKDLSDVLDDNLMSNSLTDRFLETINVTKQMVKHVELNLSDGVQEMNIKLDPENLGKVNLKIVAENGLVQAKFEAENQRVKEIIESNLSLLKESLERRGVEVSGLEVSVGSNMMNQNSNNLEETRKIALGKNPHKILGKGIKIFTSSAEINNSKLKERGLYMTKSQINYIA